MLTIVTSFNQRIYLSSHQKVRESVSRLNPESIWFCNENSFGEGVVNLTLKNNENELDLFEVNGWLRGFLRDSPFGVWQEDYWNRNAKYWFRKIVSCYTVPVVKGLLVWLDADTECLKEFSSEVIQLATENDICVIKRYKESVEAGVIIFNLNLRGRDIIESWLDFYLSLRAFKLNRWDDGAVLTYLLSKSNFKIGDLGESIYKTISHAKGPLKKIREVK